VVLTVVAVSGVAGASPMDVVSWQVYDSFPGSALNTGLWAVENNNGTLNTGTGGLILSPTSLSGGGTNRVSINATLGITNGAFFAAQVPFSITGAAGSGGAVLFSISLNSNGSAESGAIMWVNANNFQIAGTGYAGSGFAVSTDFNPPTNIQTTSVMQGELGLIYSGGTITEYYNAGTGWQQLGAPVSTAGWTGPLTFALETDVVSSGSLAAAVQNVEFNHTDPVPLPPSLLLLAPGLVGLVAARRCSKK
jgi:hypothetical protein